MKKISVVLTTFNGEGIIERVIDSILDQKGKGELFELELILIDDCSTDNTVSFFNRRQLHYFTTGINSGGPNKGRNMGLKAATGDYICITDQDDQWQPERIQTLLPYLEKADIVTSGFTLIDSSTKKTIERINHKEAGYIFYQENETFLNKLSRSHKGQQAYLGSIIYSSKLKDILFEEHFGVVDFDWILRLLHKQSSLEVCRSLYKRFVDGQNLSLNETYRKIDFYYSLMTLEQYEREYPGTVRLARKKIHGSRARYYYLTDNMKKARYYFVRSGFNVKNLLYYLTTFAGSGFVKKKFNIFG